MESVKIIYKRQKTTFCKKKNDILATLSGILAGLASGLFGGGGGMIVVPGLTFFLGKSQKKAHATANFIILPVTAICGIFYGAFGNFKWEVLFPTVIGTLIGGVIGAKLLKKLSNKWVKIFFCLLTAFFGIRLLFF